VAGLEALIALRELMDGFIAIELVAPTEEFVYRPLLVAEPFGLAKPRRFSLRDIAAEHGAVLHTGILDAVTDHGAAVGTPDRTIIGYDALLVAVGARPRDWLEGAVHFSGPVDVDAMRAVVDELDEGTIGSVAFTAPPGLSWTLPLYELALLTAARLAEGARGDVRVSIVTPEPEPLEVFGPAATEHVRELCANRGIELRPSTRVLAFEAGRLELEPGGEMQVDRAVALPELVGEPIAGLPYDDAGFIPVDSHCAVLGVPGVYAAGDGIAHSVKQGGLAAQQADAAAEAIAASFGAAIEPRPFHARLRGQLLTGLGPTYFTAGVTEGGSHEASVATSPLWWPPSKIAGRYLAPYLSNGFSSGRPRQLAERPAIPPRAAGDVAGEHEQVRRIAIAFAEADASKGDHASALRWLDTVEQLDGVLPHALTRKQAEWRQRAG
jgi:sulfide:quinone oxidoreductase